MNSKKILTLGFLTVSFGILLSPAIFADSQETAPAVGSNEKMGANGTAAQYPASSDNSPKTDTTNDSKTVPSGKRHRTHNSFARLQARWQEQIPGRCIYHRRRDQ